MARTQKRSVLIIEAVGVIATIAIALFLGFSYVNHQQKLALSSPQKDTKNSQVSPITANDIAPVTAPSDLLVTTQQLNTLEAELNQQTANITTLDSDLQSIADN